MHEPPKKGPRLEHNDRPQPAARTRTTGASSSTDRPILPLAQPEAEEEDEEDSMMVGWLEELNNHHDDEGDSCSLSESRDIVEEMAFLTEHPKILTNIYDEPPCGLTTQDVRNILKDKSVRTVELGFEGQAACAHVGLGAFVAHDEMIVNVFNAEDDSISAKAVKSNLEMTREEIKENNLEVSKTKLKELMALFELGCYKRFPRRRARNRVDTRWVHTWKLGEDLIRFIKSRITMRGFKDRCEWMETFAGTASRWAQRVVNSCTVQEEDFVLFSFDVGSAFAKGMTFEELSRLTGEPLRAVEFDLASEDV